MPRLTKEREAEIAEHADQETGAMSDDGLFTEHERLNLQYALIHLPPEGSDACNAILMRMAKERAEARAELEQERVRHAACGASAIGYSGGVKKGDYGWSPSVQAVVDLYARKQELLTEGVLAEDLVECGYAMDAPSNGILLRQLNRAIARRRARESLKKLGVNGEATDAETD